MKTVILTLTAACALVLAASTHTSAAPQAGPFTPKPMAADHPLAKRAAALVELILTGNRDAVIAAMKKDGTEQLAANPNLEKMIDSQIERLAKKGYKISEFATGLGADVVVSVKGDAGEEGVVIRFSATEPHKFTGFARLTGGA